MHAVVIPELADAGLALQAVLPAETLDADVLDALRPASRQLGSAWSLVLFAQTGPTLFDRHVRSVMYRDDPFDETAVELVRSWFARSRPDARCRVVYPGSALLPLGRLAEQAGWGSPSPLGLTINPRFGLWLAHRVVVVTDAELDPPPIDSADHPCSTCDTSPCVGACPVGAVSVATGFDLETCARHRIAPGSPCALQCLSRNACPVGGEYRYGPEQTRHHYAAGLDSIRRWLEPDLDGR